MMVFISWISLKGNDLRENHKLPAELWLTAILKVQAVMFFMQGKIGDAVRVRGKMCMSTSRMHTGPPGGCMGRDLIFIKQAQLRLCKLGPGTVFKMSFSPLWCMMHDTWCLICMIHDAWCIWHDKGCLKWSQSPYYEIWRKQAGAELHQAQLS